MRYELVLFDVDGTILDTSEGIIASVKYVIEQKQLQMPSLEVLKTFIGPPIQDSFKRVYGLPDAEITEMATMFRAQYKDVDLLKAVPYEGIFEVFKFLREKGCKLAIATFKRQDYAETIVKHFGFHNYAEIICGSDFEGKFKKKDIISNAIKLSGVTDKSKILMIGDTSLDAEGAVLQGVDFLGVTFGFGYKEKNDVQGEHVIGVAESATDIIDIIEG